MAGGWQRVAGGGTYSTSDKTTLWAPNGTRASTPEDRQSCRGRGRSFPPGERLPAGAQEKVIADREKITDGANERAVNETIAGTGPGIPDDALLPGAELPEPPSDEEVARVAKKLGAPVPETEE